MNGTAARQSPALPVGGTNASGEFAPDAWLDAGDSLDVRARLVCLGAIAAYGARFGFAHYLGIEIASAQQLIHQAYTHAYPAFLLLYVTLIVLACISQHLYRTPREIRAFEETFKVVKAVGFATALLVLFIFVSSNKEIS